MQSNRRRLFPAAAIIIFAPLSSCRLPSQSPNPYPTVGAIPVPAGFHRIPARTAAFATWLRNIRLKKDRTVYLYNNHPKGNQEAQFAVLDVSVGKQDLQQCADAVMRLRAEYFYAAGDYDDINYYTEQGVRLNFQAWLHGQRAHLSGDRLISYRGPAVAHPSEAPQRAAFDEYLNIVFTYCGTRSPRVICRPRTSISSSTRPVRPIVPGTEATPLGPASPHNALKPPNGHSRSISYDGGQPPSKILIIPTKYDKNISIRTYPRRKPLQEPLIVLTLAISNYYLKPTYLIIQNISL